MQEAATSGELKNAFGDHLTENQNHFRRLEIFDVVGEDAGTTKCAAMAGVADEGEDMIDETGKALHSVMWASSLQGKKQNIPKLPATALW